MPILENLEPPEKEKICSLLRNAIAVLEDEDIQALVTALQDARWGHSQLAAELNRRGFKCNNEQIRLHRSKQCNCA